LAPDERPLEVVLDFDDEGRDGGDVVREGDKVCVDDIAAGN
jgi:hypothetical protein